MLAFIFLGGVVVTGALVFRIQEITAKFHNGNQLITDADAAIATYKEAAAEVAAGRHIFLGLDREKVIEAVETSDHRIRVKYIEAKFPNRLEISVEERYPMYYISGAGRTAILDWELKIISDDHAIVARFNPININGQFTLSDNFAEFELGNRLHHFIIEDIDYMPSDDLVRAETLILMARIFFGQNHQEDALCHLIQDVDFAAPATLYGSMVLVLTDTMGRFRSILIEIRNFTDDFAERLRLAWECLQTETNYQYGHIIVEEDFTTMWLPGSANGV